MCATSNLAHRVQMCHSEIGSVDANCYTAQCIWCGIYGLGRNGRESVAQHSSRRRIEGGALDGMRRAQEPVQAGPLSSNPPPPRFRDCRRIVDDVLAGVGYRRCFVRPAGRTPRYPGHGSIEVRVTAGLPVDVDEIARRRHPHGGSGVVGISALTFMWKL